MSDSSAFDVLLGNSNKRFSGVTSTMLQTLEHQKHQVALRILGGHHLQDGDASLALTFWQAVKACRKPAKSGEHYIFHARRNDEIIQALILKFLFRIKLKIVFTSTAQRYHSRFTRMLMSQVNVVISTCQAAAKYLETPPARMIPHGVDTSVFHPAPSPTSDQEINIGVFGRVRPQKGSDLITRAAIAVLPRHPHARLTFIGAITADQAAFVAQLEAEIADAGLSDRIRFTGELEFEEIPKRMRTMQLVIALSLNEGFGLTVLEAMSSGAAVLASEAGAWPDIIDEGVHGLVVPTADLQATTDALERLLQDSKKLVKMGAAGRAHVLAHYSIEQEATALCSLYQDMQNAKI